MANFNPTRKCLENEHECYNSYGYKICVEEKIKFIACASYSPRMCNDNENFYKKISDYQFVVFKLLTKYQNKSYFFNKSIFTKQRY